MKNSNNSFDDLFAEAVECLQRQTFSTSTIKKYISTWMQIKVFMVKQELQTFNAVVSEKFLLIKFGDYQYEHLTRQQKCIVRRIQFLTEYQETGSVIKKRKSREIELPGSIGCIMAAFVAKNKSNGYSHKTIHSHLLYLSRFLNYLTGHGIIELSMINQVNLVIFANNCHNDKPMVKHYMMSVVRTFLRYLYDELILEVDYSKIIPKENFKRQTKLPSVYSIEEITKMLNAIDRANPKGKRDYAAILLAARLGLRASDICNLQFHNLNWAQCQIIITQFKTKNELTLPLMAEIGDAIIDYLKFGRPISNLPYIFINHIAPFDQMTNINLCTSVSNYLQQAGIKINDRKHGTHVLRHSLAQILLKDKTPLPVITEVLGHKDTSSTMYYLRIDIDSLRQCALNVPSVDSTFYKSVDDLYFNLNF